MSSIHNTSGSVKRAPSTDALRNFYFSGATNYAAFKSKADKSNVSGIDDSASSQPQNTSSAPVAAAAADAPSVVPQAAPVNVPAGSALKAVKQATTPAAGAANTSSVSAARTADSVSPEYIVFLRQQQDLIKAHNAIGDSLKTLLGIAATHQEEHVGSSTAASELLAAAESSTNWHWKSKFDLAQLVKDADLRVGQDELCAADALPVLSDLKHQHQQIVKLRQNRKDATEFHSLLDNGIRRMERLIKEFDESQLDSGPVTRLSDPLMVQLDHVMSMPPLSKVLEDVDDSIRIIEAKRKQCQGARDQALEDGAMDVAERESYRLADLSEELVKAQIERIRLLSSVSQEHAVTLDVRDAYVAKVNAETQRLTGDSMTLRQRSEADLANLYQLRRLADDAEKSQADAWQADRDSSNARLANIATRQQEAWAQIALLVKQLLSLEDERHIECKRRVENKVKDESRRNEYTVFCNVADTQAANLDRTIKNCDINIHCAKLMQEFVSTGFNTIEKYISSSKSTVDSELLNAQQNHLALYRALMFTLGDLDYKKGKKIEEVNANVQAAHIQQELCSDSLNPNAKKFSDAKRELLRIRDELELELADLKERQRVATDQFEPTEAALLAANIEHVHPVEELEDWRLDTRAKMVEYKAMALGHSNVAPLHAEVQQLRRTFNDSKRLALNSRSSMNNTNTSGL